MYIILKKSILQKRKRKKKAESDSEEKEEDEDENESPSKGGRKHIRKMIKTKKLKEETKAASKAEEERRERIAERQKRVRNTETRLISSITCYSRVRLQRSPEDSRAQFVIGIVRYKRNNVELPPF